MHDHQLGSQPFLEMKKAGHMCPFIISVRPYSHSIRVPLRYAPITCILASAQPTAVFPSPASARWDDPLQCYHVQQAIF